MANSNRPAGLYPVRYLSGSEWNMQVNQYFIASANASAFAIGDPVASSGTGDSNGVPGVQLAVAGTGSAIRGVMVGAGGIIYGGPGADPTNLATTIIPAVKTTCSGVLMHMRAKTL